MATSLGILSGLMKGKATSGGEVVSDQLVAAFGTTALNGNIQPMQMVQIPSYGNSPLTSLRLSLNVTDSTSTTAPSGVTPIETIIKQFEIQTNSGRIITDFDGSWYDISLTARYLTQGGLYNASPTPADSAASTQYTSEWDLVLPISISLDEFPLKLFVSYNTINSRATTLNGMTSTINFFKVYASYAPHSFIPAMIKNITIPVPGTGNISLQQYYDMGKTYLMQAYEYGTPSTTNSASDSPIGPNGNGVTFTPNGQLYLQNAPLQSFIEKENITYANSIGPGNGHIYGVVNLFTSTFTDSAATQLQIGFTSTPSAAGNANSLRTIWVEAL